MKKSVYVRFSVTILLLLSLLSPSAVLAAGDGKKHFKKGMKHESAEEWDLAVEEFALAIVDNPKNPEYRLHYQRALFNASQMFMKKGTAQANEGDFAGAYLSFRKAYGYDPVNELAKSEMARMLRLQREAEPGGTADDKDAPDGVKLVPTGFNGTGRPDDVVLPQRLEKLRDVPFPNPVDLTWLIKELAKDLDLNVLFDIDSRLDTRKIKIELKNVTAAKALDYIFLQENLFFQKVGPRTILVALGNRRQNYQQLVLRTFYLANASPKDVANVVKTAIPAQPGRTPTIVLTDDATNSITIRDTSENIRLIGKLIGSLDKDRAEVVMDVQIYEVSKTDLLQLGNQIGSREGLTNLGGTTSGVLAIGGNGLDNIDKFGLPIAIGTGIILPSATLQAFQSKNNTKLIASTQIHAFNNEDSSARIGQRVPVRTASFAPVGTTTGNNTNNFVGDVINYEQTGLTLKFKPLVFPNQDVQVTMEIESKDVAGALSDTPTFTERTIKGTARVQNNKTLLLASVAQGVESEGRSGLPILGLIPILGRLFTAPSKDNRQVDVVIAITPKVIRAPVILPEDLEERDSGSLATPTSSSLEAMVIQEEIEEQLAAARRLGNSARVQLPDQAVEQPTYVKSDAATVSTAGRTEKAFPTMNPPAFKAVQTDPAPAKTDTRGTASVRNDESVGTENRNSTAMGFSEHRIATSETLPFSAFADKILPIDSAVKTLQIESTSEPAEKIKIPAEGSSSGVEGVAVRQTSLTSDFADEIKIQPVVLSDLPNAKLSLLPGVRDMKAGEKTRIAVIISTSDAFRSAVLGLQFDPKKMAVRSVGLGDLFGEEFAHRQVTPFLNKDGKMYVTLSVSKDVGGNNSGVLAYIEIEALTSGRQEIAFDQEALNFMTAKGKSFTVDF